MRQFAKSVVLQLLRGYKWAVSPLLPPSCRYVPTCSEYAMEAVDRYGVLRGGFMAFVRVLRCHPFVRGGYDPVVQAEQAAIDRLGSAPSTSSGQALRVAKGSKTQSERALQGNF
jgi:putative membrane protein insertion efficiency factor